MFWPESHNKEQWEKLKGLPNLIYTDGREWALYRNGERQGGIVRPSGRFDEVSDRCLKLVLRRCRAR
jgi:hypothetical protein